MSELRKDLTLIVAVFAWSGACSLAFFWVIGVPEWLFSLWGKWLAFYLILTLGVTLFPHLLRHLSGKP